MKRTVSEKIYIIINLNAGKQYVGRTRNLDSRYSGHVSRLRAGKHENPDLQRDWDRDGEHNFIWLDVLLRAGDIRLKDVEDLLMGLLDTIDPLHGYNRMTNSGWSPHTRLRDLERKLMRRKKFELIPGVSLDDPILAKYLETVWKGQANEKFGRPDEAGCGDEGALENR